MRGLLVGMMAGLLACGAEDGGESTPSADLGVSVEVSKGADVGRQGQPDGAGGAALGDVGLSGDTAADDLDMSADDFGCILEWDQAGAFRITNRLGNTAEALAVAQSPNGGVFPVGTVIQLIPFEAMVKRKAGFSPTTNDWEFFALEATAEGTTISARGTQEVINQFGGNCFECHAKAGKQWDFVCGSDHGCDALPLSPETIKAVQDADPRCQ